MRARRFVVCILAIVAIAIANIYYQALVVQYGYELGRLQTKAERLRVSITALEGKVTMLASPARLKSENEKWQLGLVGPSKWQQPPTAVAAATVEGGSGHGVARR